MSKITHEHLSREAVVYISQSTADQVAHNLESQRRQYGLLIAHVNSVSYDRNWVTESERDDVSWRLSRPAINSKKERYAYVEHNHPATSARYNR